MILLVWHCSSQLSRVTEVYLVTKSVKSVSHLFLSRDMENGSGEGALS